MAKKVKLFNYGRRAYVDMFNGEKIAIRPNRGIIMERHAAVVFMGKMSPMGFIDENGHVDMDRPQEKKLRIEPIDEPQTKDEKEDKKFICNLDGREFSTQEELDEYLATISDQTVEMDDGGNIEKTKKKEPVGDTG